MTRLRGVLSALIVLVLGLPAVAAADTFQGSLSIVWGDPYNRTSAGDIRYILETPDRQYIELRVSQSANELLPLQGQRVVVTGQLAARPAIANGPDEPSIVATSIVADPSAPRRADQPKVSGVRSVIFILTKFSDDSAVPHLPQFYLDLTNPDTSPDATIPSTINAFFKKTSNNLFSWSASVGGQGGVGASGGWITLPQPKSYYANCNFSVSCFSFSRYDTDAVAAAQAQGINFDSYTNVNFVVSNDLDCCAWGGSLTIGSISHGATWEPPWGQITSTYAHEMGHSLGLPHSGWVYYAYDSPWDTLSSIQSESFTLCGSYASRNAGSTQNLNCDVPGDGYIAPHKDVVGWIPAANIVTVPLGGAATATLEGSALAVGANAKMIKICIPGSPCTGTGSTTRYFTVEARVKGLGTASRFDNAIPGDGIIIHDVWFGRAPIGGACFFNSQSGWAVPIDATPGDYVGSPTCSGAGLSNAQFTAGMTYTNNTYGFRVSIGARAGSTWSVTVSGLATIAGDFDGDAKADMVLYKPNGDWAILKSSSGYTASTVVNYGGPGYVPVPGDYDGDGRIDPAVYNTSTGQWLALKSSTNYTTTFSQSWGGAGYSPAAGDYDGDGKTDPTVYVPATGQWLVLKSSTGYSTTINVSWGGTGYTAVPGLDFDGDKKSDIVIYSETTGYWYILQSSTNFTTATNINCGGHGYTLVGGDYDGDGKADPGLYQRSTGIWYILKSSTSYTTTINQSWGGAGYDPVPGDYDGDGKLDLAIIQRSTGNWYVLRSSSGFTTSLSVAGWGASSDTIVSSAIVVGASDTLRSTDFDADSKSDITVYQASTGMWLTLLSASSYTTAQNRSWGGAGYTPAPGDFDGDGKVDYALYQQATGDWSILLSGAGFTTSIAKNCGGPGYIPVVGDFDGDGKSDIVVYNTSTGLWFGFKSSTGFTGTLSVSWGGTGYTAAPGDFDGDGKADLGLYQGSTGNWSVLLSSSGYTTTLSRSVGGAGYVPAQGDYDGDGKTDFVVYNTTSGLWYGLKSSTGYTTTISVGWGGTGYTPVRGDFDGDGKIDLAIYQTSSGTWYVLLSASGYTTSFNKSWGGAGYTPTQAYP